MPFPLNVKGTTKSATAITRFWNTCSVYVRTHMHRISLKVVKYSTRESGHDQKKRSPPLSLRCQVWQSAGASTDISVNIQKEIDMHVEIMTKQNSEVREKKKTSDIREISLPSRRARGNAHARKYAFDFGAKSFQWTDRQTHTHTHKDRREFSAEVSPQKSSAAQHSTKPTFR